MEKCQPETVSACIHKAYAVSSGRSILKIPIVDGIFALFGALLAHEAHPQRALYTALLMQEESLSLTLVCR
jgi:hypothetical protein